MDGWAEGTEDEMEGFNGTSGELSTSRVCFMRRTEQKEKRDKTCASWPKDDIDRGSLKQAGKRRLRG